ncbi:phosphotransferase [Candidatus Magnetobacterium bavaricum]|uniref:Phosphotransferase n=1 Tax=Candidatus Magnetobacterium bavaricum TaxID=29290 RepID=A0A0F3GTL0_9BACT|nr:phosphotransferase [Candidatus Magnetobacterium bavaricum]
MQRPLVSVVMPAYNHELFIEEAVESVLRQTYTELELIIINDGSSDNTQWRVLQYDDPRIRYEYQQNTGSHSAINRGIGIAGGQYISIINSDDVYLCDRLRSLVEASTQDNLDFIITDIGLIDKDSEPITDPNHWWNQWYGALKSHYRAAASPLMALLAGNYTISTSNFFFRRSLVDDIGLFRARKYTLDYDFAYRAIRHNEQGFAYFIDSQLMLYRLHGDNAILKDPLVANLETFHFLTNAIKEQFGDDIHVPIEHVNKIRRYITRMARCDLQRQVATLQTESRWWEAEANKWHAENVKSLTEAHKWQHEAHNWQVETQKWQAGAMQWQTHSQICQQEAERRQVEFHVKAAEFFEKLHEAKIAYEELRIWSYDMMRYATDLFNERFIYQGSLSYRLGRTLTLPLRTIKGRYRSVRITVNDVGKLRLHIQNLMDRVDIVSFDIFDTLLERIVEPPDKVKEIVARFACQDTKKLRDMELSPVDFLALRSKVETQLRHGSLSEGKDYECSYSNIVRGMVQELTGRYDEELFDAIIHTELEVEKKVLYVKDGIRDILKMLKGAGKRLIAISDMYLDRLYLEAIFEDKAILEFFDSIYVSSESRVGKHSGRLFKQVLFAQKTLPERVLHVGDNPHSDFKVPANLGINAIRLFDLDYHKRKYALLTYHRFAVETPYWRGRHLLQMIRPATGAKEDFFYQYGFSFLGPVYATFIYGVVSAIKQAKIKKVFFLAREGELFHELFKMAAPGFLTAQETPPLEYVYLTRKSTALASVYRGLTFEKAVLPFFNPKQEGLYSLFNVYGLPVQECFEIARRHGFTELRQPIDAWQDKRFMQLLQDERFQLSVIKHARPNRRLLRKYLRQIGFFNGESVAFVDIGWNATIQKFIQDAFSKSADYPHVYGIYLGFCDGIRHAFDYEKNTILGILYDQRNNNPVEHIFSRFEELFEEGARALHPTTVGYIQDPVSKVVNPVFKEDASTDRIEEITFNEKIRSIKTGAIAFTGQFIEAARLSGYTFDDIKPFILTMAERAVAFPTREELSHLMNLKHSEDFGYENVMSLQADEIESKRILFNPSELKKKIRWSNWRYGTVKSLGLPGGNFIFRIFDALRRF